MIILLTEENFNLLIDLKKQEVSFSILNYFTYIIITNLFELSPNEQPVLLPGISTCGRQIYRFKTTCAF